MEELNINTPDNFAYEIEELVWWADISYFDAVLEYCKKNNLEVETAAALINKNQYIKSKIQIDAEDLNFLPKTARLPDIKE